MRLTPSEIRYWESMDSQAKIVSLIQLRVAEAPPWQPMLPLPDDVLDGLERRMSDNASITAIYELEQVLLFLT